MDRSSILNCTFLQSDQELNWCMQRTETNGHYADTNVYPRGHWITYRWHMYSVSSKYLNIAMPVFVTSESMPEIKSELFRKKQRVWQSSYLHTCAPSMRLSGAYVAVDLKERVGQRDVQMTNTASSHIVSNQTASFTLYVGMDIRQAKTRKSRSCTRCGR